ncbi:MAG TPA: ABC transporter ATP-binding protein [Anaeromyxobacteraceae bacterium]|nr:ABC transporter ATP-binding protein [Anaeromyxobacteraceae bacterium]
MDALLETEGLTRDFSGFLAVKGVNLRVRRGSIHALIGPNGAGKTTLFNLLTRVLPASSGRILFAGQDITRLSPAQVARMGMGRSFQMSAVFPTLSVAENVRIALQRPLGISYQFWRSPRALAALDGAVGELLAAVDLERLADAIAVELPYGRKRALELVTTLALDPQLLLLDEPTQGMGHEDVGRVVELIRRVARNRTVLLVEHNLSVVADLCDAITVLQRGSVLAEGSYAEVSRNPTVLDAYIGGRP